MNIEFTKMHGLGNDFVVIDAINQSISLTSEQVRFIADRHLGVGCDQLLLVQKPQSVEAEFCYRIFNADGDEVQQCGNGARCFARFVVDKGLTNSQKIPVETCSGKIVLEIEPNGEVTVDMGVPSFLPKSLPFLPAPGETDTAMQYALDTSLGEVNVATVSVGNPHAVLQVDNIETAPVEQLGPEIEGHVQFPERVNAGFMQIVSEDEIRLRVYERGVGETQACGTGACAAVAAGRRQAKLAETVKVSLPGGELVIRWAGENQNLFMTGPATRVFEGNITL